jgi:hypothetical protein
MAREISLTGGDTSVLKAIGMSGVSIRGSMVIERLGNDLAPADLIDTLEGLMMFDYILASTDRFRTLEDVEKADFKVNPACAKELRDAVSGRSREPEQRRRRRG